MATSAEPMKGIKAMNLNKALWEKDATSIPATFLLVAVAP
jgi:hypothetical protein